MKLTEKGAVRKGKARGFIRFTTLEETTPSYRLVGTV